MAFSQIFPYINQLIEDLGVAKDPSGIGYYSGLVVCVLLFHANCTLKLTKESAFAVTQLIGTYPWGHLSGKL